MSTLKKIMVSKENNYAFIDGQNLHLGIRALGWKLDMARFRKYLKDKYAVSKAFLFIGYVGENSDLYKALQEAGYICIFKPTLVYKEGKTKGNCDAELVLHAMIEYQRYNKAAIITGDGDFHCLIKYLIEQKKLKKLLVPNEKSYSALLKRFPSEYVAFVSSLQHKVAYAKRGEEKNRRMGSRIKRKEPRKDRP